MFVPLLHDIFIVGLFIVLYVEPFDLFYYPYIWLILAYFLVFLTLLDFKLVIIVIVLCVNPRDTSDHFVEANWDPKNLTAAFFLKKRDRDGERGANCMHIQYTSFHGHSFT